MSAIAETMPSRPRRRKRIDGWRWAGCIFLVLMLIYTAVPMVWMLLTSIKSGFAALQFPPQWWPAEPTLASYRSCSIRRTASAPTSSASSGTVFLFRP